MKRQWPPNDSQRPQEAPESLLDAPNETPRTEAAPEAKATPESEEEGPEMPRSFQVLSALIHELPDNHVDESDMLDALRHCAVAMEQKRYEAERRRNWEIALSGEKKHLVWPKY